MRRLEDREMISSPSCVASLTSPFRWGTAAQGECPSCTQVVYEAFETFFGVQPTHGGSLFLFLPVEVEVIQKDSRTSEARNLASPSHMVLEGWKSDVGCNVVNAPNALIIN